jgi:hypothetical protein
MPVAMRAFGYLISLYQWLMLSIAAHRGLFKFKAQIGSLGRRVITACIKTSRCWLYDCKLHRMNSFTSKQGGLGSHAHPKNNVSRLFLKAQLVRHKDTIASQYGHIQRRNQGITIYLLISYKRVKYWIKRLWLVYIFTYNTIISFRLSSSTLRSRLLYPSYWSIFLSQHRLNNWAEYFKCIIHCRVCKLQLYFISFLL